MAWQLPRMPTTVLLRMQVLDDGLNHLPLVVRHHHGSGGAPRLKGLTRFLALHALVCRRGVARGALCALLLLLLGVLPHGLVAGGQQGLRGVGRGVQGGCSAMCGRDWGIFESGHAGMMLCRRLCMLNVGV
jgi:hypothetical protein